MNWKLVFLLSLFGMAMAIATVFWIPINIEWLFWLIIFLICAYIIAKNAPGKYFLHGFMVSVFNCLWITAAHYLLFDKYMAAHPGMIDDNAKMPLDPKIMMLIIGPVVGIASGLVLGLFSFVASKLVKK